MAARIKSTTRRPAGRTPEQWLRWSRSYARGLHKGDALDGFHTLRAANEYLRWCCEKPFPQGIAALPATLTLYRMLLLDSPDALYFDGEGGFGRHYTGLVELTSTHRFLSLIGFQQADMRSGRMYRARVEVAREHLDLENTLGGRIDYPDEYEYTLLGNAPVRLMQLEPLAPAAITGTWW